MRRLGACANTRDAGLPDPAEIAQYDRNCRAETHYAPEAPAVELSSFGTRICRAPLDWRTHNQALMWQIYQETGRNDLETLAASFEDSRFIDDGTVGGRLEAILIADAHPIVPGLEGAHPFSDVGFRGDHNPGGSGFRDPHSSSRDQIGHFLTGVGLGYDPSRVSRVIQVMNIGEIGVPTGIRVRDLLGAAADRTDEDVAFGLMVGHELAPDPLDSEGRLTMIQGFRAQFSRATPDYINAFQEAARIAMNGVSDRAPSRGTPERLNIEAAETSLRRIPLHYEWRGNSIQDLRLTTMAFSLGRLIRSGYFQEGHQISQWLQVNLGVSTGRN